MNITIKTIGWAIIALFFIGLSFVSGMFIGKKDCVADTVIIGHELPKDTIIVEKLVKSVQIRVEKKTVPVLIHDTITKDSDLKQQDAMVFQSELSDTNVRIVHTYAAEGIVLWDSTKYELFPRPIEFRTQTKDISKHWIAGATLGRNFINPMVGYRFKDYVILAGYKIAETGSFTVTALKFLK